MFFIVLISAFAWNSLAIVVPQDSWDKVRKYKNAHASREEIENQILTNEVPCLTRFLSQNLPSHQVPIIIPTTPISRNTQYFLKNLQLEMSIFVLREKFNYSRNYNGSLNILLLLDDTSLVEKVTKNLVYICSQKCVYVAIVTKFYEHMDHFMEDADELVQKLWERRIANVAIISLVERSVQLAKSISFKSGVIREPSSPEFFGSCKETNGWDKDRDKIFSPMTLNGTVVKVAFFQTDPYTIVSNDSDTVQGIEGDLLNVVLEDLGLGSIGDEISWTGVTDDLTEIRKKFNSNDSIDIVVGALQWAPTWDVDYTFPYKVAKMVWLIPVEPNVSLEGLIAPFDSDVWYAIGVVLILTILIKRLFLRDISFLDVFALIIGTSTPEQPVKLSSRIQYLSWAIFGYILSQSYLASLAGVLVDEANEQIATMEELVSDGIQFGGTRRFRELFASPDTKDDSDEDRFSDSNVIDEIYKKFVVLKYEKYVQSLQDLIDGKNKDMALVAVLNFSSTDDNFDKTKVQQLKEPLGSYPLAFAVCKGLPYLDQLERKIMILTESGFIGFWERRYVTGDDDELGNDESSDNLGLPQLAPGFLLLVIGVLAGILALFGEIIHDCFKKRRRIRDRVKVMALKWRKKTKTNNLRRKRGKAKIQMVQKVVKTSNKLSYNKMVHTKVR